MSFLNLQLIKQTLGLQQQNNLVHSSTNVDLADIHGQIRLLVNWGLVWVVNTGETLDLTLASLGVDATLVGLLTDLERSGDVDKVERSVLLNDLTSSLAGSGERSDRGSNDGSARASELRGNETNTLDHVVKHIMHIGELSGYDHVGLGTDFDGIESTPRGLEDVSKFPDLINALLKKGISEGDAGKIAGRNLLRVWREVDKVAARLQEEIEPIEDDISARL